MSDQNAFVHPFYNPDILSLIFRACEWVGPLTMFALGLTHRVALRTLHMNARWPALVTSYCKVLAGYDPKSVGNVSYELWQAYAIKTGDLKGVPKWALDADMFDLMIPRNGLVIRFMYGLSKKLQTPERFMQACAHDGMALQHVPAWARDRELYMIACTQNGKALTFVPKKKQWTELCLCACEHRGSLTDVRVQTSEIVIAAIRCNSWNIQHANPKFLSLELCVNAMRRTFGGVLQSIPTDMLRLNNEMCDLATRSQAFVLLPVDLMTRERIIMAILYARIESREQYLIQRLRNNGVTILDSTWHDLAKEGLSLRCIPDECRSLEVCLAGVHSDGDIRYVPPMLMDMVRAAKGWDGA